jgi:hypothetical protein
MWALKFYQEKIYKRDKPHSNMLKEEVDSRLKKTNIFDIQLIKISVFFFAFWIASYIPSEFLSQYRWIWFLIFIISAIPVFWKFWLNCGGKCKTEKYDKKK